VLAQGAELLSAVSAAPSIDVARGLLSEAIANGQGRERFERMVAAQGGRLAELPAPAPVTVIVAERDGFLQRIDLERVGYAMLGVGGGRNRKEDAIDPAVGMEFLKRLGDPVRRDEPLVRLFANSRGRDEAVRLLHEAFELSDSQVSPPALIVERITAAGPGASPTKGGGSADIDWPSLVRLATASTTRAYAPYSNFHVGAALLAADGAGRVTTFTGTNVENGSYGLTQCAERSAVTAAVSAGFTRPLALAIASPGGVTPCGACRQVLAEFAGTELPIRLVDSLGGRPEVHSTLGAFLPNAFHGRAALALRAER
jgi:homotetrameric cytidine deaminase